MLTQRCMHLVVVLTAFLCLPAATASTVLFEATYKGEYSGWNVTLVRTLTQTEEGQYKLTSSAKNLFASIEESSLFNMKQNQIVPLDYRYSRKVFGTRKEEAIAYDWQKAIAQFERSDKPGKETIHELTPGVLDPSLYQLQLQKDLFTGKKELSYRFVKRNKIKNYDFDIVREETLTLGGKERRAVVLERADVKDDRLTKVWLIPELHYQIGKIFHRDEDGDTYEIVLAHYRSDATELDQFYRDAAAKKMSD